MLYFYALNKKNQQKYPQNISTFGEKGKKLKIIKYRREKLASLYIFQLLGPHHLLYPSMNRCENESDGMNDIMFS